MSLCQLLRINHKFQTKYLFSNLYPDASDTKGEKGRILSQRLIASSDYVVEDVFEEVVRQRLNMLVPHVRPLFEWLIEIADDPHAMLAFYKTYRSLLSDEADRKEYTGHQRVSWMSQHLVGERVDKGEYFSYASGPNSVSN